MELNDLEQEVAPQRPPQCHLDDAIPATLALERSHGSRQTSLING